MRGASAADRLRIRAIADAMTHAAEQVQDKRIELLAAGPEVTFSQVVLDVCIGFILEAPLVGKLASRLARDILLPRVRFTLATQEYAFRTLALSRPNERILVRTILDPSSDLFRRRADTLQKDIARLRLFHEALEGAETVANYATAVAKAVRGARQESLKIALPPTDTPGVAVRAAVDGWYRREAYGIEIGEAMFEEAVRTGKLEPDFETLAARSAIDQRVFTEGMEGCKRATELVIWVILIMDQHRATGRGMTGTPVKTIEQLFYGIHSHVPGSLYDYFLIRFINPSTQRPFLDSGTVSVPGAPTISVGARELAQHLFKTARHIQKEGLAAIIISNARDHPFTARK